MKQPERGGLHPIQDALEGYLSGAGLGSARDTARVNRAWCRAAGTALSSRARPVRFTGGVLLVEVSSAAHLQELTSFTGEALRQKSNEILRGEMIRSIEFKLKR